MTWLGYIKMKFGHGLGLGHVKHGGGGGAYHADAVHFDGSTYLSINSLTATNNKDFSLSYWFQISEDTNTNSTLWVSDPAGNYVTYGDITINGTEGRFRSHLFNSTGSAGFTINGDNSTSYKPFDIWHHFLLSVDTNHAAGQKVAKLYIDDADVTGGITDANAAFDIAFNALSFFVGSDASSGFIGDIAEFWCAINQSLLTAGDIPEATRRKFITDSGRPVDLGADGSTPTGTAPRVFFKGNAAAFVTNLGTGGAFTLNGSLTNASTSPSD